MTDESSEQRLDADSEDKKLEELVRYIRSLGLERLANDIAEERFARRLIESRIAYDYYAVQGQIWKSIEERALENSVSVQAALFDKASSYTNVVTTLGYAGFFSVWSLVSGELTRTENALVGFCLGISLLIFVLWTLIMTALITMNFRKYAIIDSSEFSTFDETLDAHKTAEEKINRANLRMQRYWPFQFILSSVSALVAGTIVLVELFLQIIGIEFDLLNTIFGGILK